MGIQHVRFLPDGIAFDRYPYRGARVHRRGLVPWSEVLEVDPTASPSEVRVAGETLFVSAELRDELARAAEAHGVPAVRREDVWDMLLEPFLDTWFDDDVQERTLQRLEENGIRGPRRRASASASSSRCSATMPSCGTGCTWASGTCSKRTATSGSACCAA